MKNKFVMGAVIILLLTIAGIVMNVVYSSRFITEYLQVSELKKAYIQESASLPELGEPEFMAYGGELLVKTQVGEKGSVTFWYDPLFVPRFTLLNDKSVEYSCEFPDKSETFVMALKVLPGSLFMTDFGFEIRTLADLVTHFDELVAKVDEYRNSPAAQESHFLQLPETESIVACQLIKA